MLVKITAFGCNWWRRFGSDPNDRFRYTKHAACYNSSGVQCGKKIRRHWVVPGLIRFNGAGNFAAHDLNCYIGRTFSCTEPVLALGGNRVLFQERVADDSTPDFFLVVVSSSRYGLFDFHSEWKSEGAVPIAASHLREQQEAMLLMRVGDWVETAVGRWHLTKTDQLSIGAALQLSG
jgi:hypothetical protein